MEMYSLLISVFALLVSLASVYFTNKNWKEGHRPRVVISVEFHQFGKSGSPLVLMIRNRGRTSAKNIALKPAPDFLQSLFFPKPELDGLQENIKAIFTAKRKIPVLGPESQIMHPFGVISIDRSKGTWNEGYSSELEVEYSDENGRVFTDKFLIAIPDENDFGSSQWS